MILELCDYIYNSTGDPAMGGCLRTMWVKGKEG